VCVLCVHCAVNWDFKKKDESGENKRERKGTLDENAILSGTSNGSGSSSEVDGGVLGDDGQFSEIEVASAVL